MIKHKLIYTYGILFILTLRLGIGSATAESEPLKITTSLPVIASIIGEIGGDRVVIDTLMSGRINPHGFDLKPDQMVRLEKADLIVFSGLGLEYWSNTLPNRITEKVLILSSALPSANYNMHTWLDPELVIAEVKILTLRLSQEVPKEALFFQERSNRLIARLSEKLELIKARVSKWRIKEYLTYHNVLTNFAIRFGLSEYGLVGSEESHTASFKDLTELLRIAKEREIKILVVEESEPSKVATALAREGGLTIVKINPFGDGSGYFALLDSIMESLEGVLK